MDLFLPIDFACLLSCMYRPVYEICEKKYRRRTGFMDLFLSIDFVCA